MLSVLLLLSACLLPNAGTDSGSAEDDSGPAGVDADNDGVVASEDCDDNDPDIYPGAAELCDDVDQDCDEAVDEGLEQTWYMDQDGDGWGVEDDTVVACAQPGTHAAQSGDCDDTSPSVHPEAEELCNAVDDDCDEVVDYTITALSFADAADRVTIPHSEALNLGAEGTIEFWLMLEGINSEDVVGGILGKYKLAQEDKTITVFYDNFSARTGERIGAYFSTSGGPRAPQSDRDVPIDTWSHVAFSWDASGVGLYISGSLIAATGGSFDPNDADAPLYVGNLSRPEDILSDVPAFVGLMQDLRISSVRRYTQDFTPEDTLVDDADTQVLYTMREGSGASMEDAHGAGETAGIEGAEWVEVACRPEP